MSELYDKAIDNFARQLHALQVESAKLNDEHTEGKEYCYLDYNELHDEMKEWYRQKARQILKDVPELAIVDRAANFPEMNYSNERDNGVHQATKSKMKQEGFVREVRE